MGPQGAWPDWHLAAFGLGVFLVAWPLWAAGDHLAGLLDADMGLRGLLYLPGTFAPAIVALALVAMRGGAAATSGFLSRSFRWNVPLRWYVFALLFMAGTKLSAAALHRIFLGAWPEFGVVPVYLLLVAALFSAPFQVGEELGWRGFALPPLIERMGIAGAGIVVGLIWAVWHVPMFYLPGADMVGQPLAVFVVSVTALSIVMTWVWDRTGGSLPVVMLMHAAVNNTTGIVPASTPGAADPLTLRAAPMGWLTAAVLCAAALGVAYQSYRRSRPWYDPEAPAPSAA